MINVLVHLEYVYLGFYIEAHELKKKIILE